TQHENGDVRVIPILLRPVNWHGTPFSGHQALPKNALPITSWPDMDKAFLSVIEDIQETIEKLSTASVQPTKKGNLPTRSNKLLGRENEVTRALKYLRGSSQLIAIVGKRGVGKTTLALHIAHSCLPGPQNRLKPPFAYGVWISAKDHPQQ